MPNLPSRHTCLLVGMLGALVAADAPAVVEVGTDDQRISIAGSDGDASRQALAPAVAYNPTDDRYIVCWHGDDTVDDEHEISCNILTSTGGDLITGGTVVSFFGPAGNPSYGAFDPAVAYNSTDDEYLVCWSGDTNTGGLADEEREIWCRRLDQNAAPTGTLIQVSSMGGSGDPEDDALTPSVAWNFRNNNYLVCWTGDQNGTTANDEFEIYCRLLAADGTPITSQFLTSVSGGFGDAAFDAFNPRVVYGSTLISSNEYLVCWDADDDTGGQVNDELEIFCQRISGTDSTFIGPQTRISAQDGLGSALHDAQTPTIAFDPFRLRYLICWSGTDTATGVGTFEIYCGEWTRSLAQQTAPTRVSFVADTGGSSKDATSPAAVWGDELWGVCWQADADFDQAFEIDCQLLTTGPLGRRGPTPKRVSSMGSLFFDTQWQALAPAVARASDTGEWLVVWQGDDQLTGLVNDEYEIYGQRVDPLRIFADGFESGTTGAWNAAVP